MSGLGAAVAVVVAAGLTALVGALLLLTVHRIKPGHVGVIRRGGHFRAALRPGVALLLPFVDRLQLIDVPELDAPYEARAEQAVRGARGIVVEPVAGEAEPGLVLVLGIPWVAVTAAGGAQALANDTVVTVSAVRDGILVVRSV